MCAPERCLCAHILFFRQLVGESYRFSLFKNFCRNLTTFGSTTIRQ